MSSEFVLTVTGETSELVSVCTCVTVSVQFTRVSVVEHGHGGARAWGVVPDGEVLQVGVVHGLLRPNIYRRLVLPRARLGEQLVPVMRP